MKSANESIFLKEYSVSKAKQAMPISARCNLRCIFCSNYNNPFRIYQGTFRDIADIKLNLPMLQLPQATINLSDSLPGRIAEGEALLHPKIFEILDLIRNQFGLGVTIQLATNGTTLTEETVRQLAAYKPVKINTLSLNSTNLKNWQRLTGGNQRLGKIAINAPRLLKKYFINFEGSLVACPELTGWNDIEKTIKYYVDNNAREIIVWHPGYSKLIPAKKRYQIRCSFEQLSRFVIRLRKKYRKSICVLPDLRKPHDLNIHGIMESTESLGKTNILWLVSAAAHKMISTEVKKFMPYVWNRHWVVPVKNQTYGGNIIVAGLLTVPDFVKAGKKFLMSHPKIDLILIPDDPFDAAGRDLTYIPYHQIEEKLRCPVRKIVTMTRSSNL
ncbi:MAG: DUF512 domain-containing protein [Planctomycetes bacterium]|nr:DUF512 domain-containing protein [Planctomycetota bacterium]